MPKKPGKRRVWRRLGRNTRSSKKKQGNWAKKKRGGKPGKITRKKRVHRKRKGK